MKISNGIVYLEEGERLPGHDKHARLRRITIEQHNKLMYGVGGSFAKKNLSQQKKDSHAKSRK